MQELEIKQLLNLDETIAKELLQNEKYPWECITKINDFILKLGESLDNIKYNKIGKDIWIAKTANIADTACIIGPVIIDENAEIRHSAFIRGNVIVGKNAVVGNSTEIKNSILFNNVQVPHFNYVGDSILGFKSHMGASSILSNVRSDKRNVTIKYDGKKIETGLKKFGSILGDESEIGCGAILNPGTVLSRNSIVYPLNSVSGYVKK